jgi:Xaa-Pro aminopeptidase
MPVDNERQQRLREGLQNAHLDAVLAWRPEELVMTTGACPHWGMTVALIPQRGDPVQYPVSLEPDAAIAKDMTVKKYDFDDTGGFRKLEKALNADLKNLGIKTVGIVPDGGRHAPAGNSAEAMPFSVPFILGLLADVTVQETSFFADQMLHKTAYEVEKIQLANDVAAYGLSVFYQNLDAGKSEAEVAAEIERAIRVQTGKHGTSLTRAWAYVQGGRNSALAGTYSRSSGYVLQEGDMVLLEMATFVDGYWSDLTRTGMVGAPSDAQVKLMETVSRSQRAALDALREGVTGAQVDAAARAVMIDAGFGDAFTHHTGHQVGFRYHDYGPLLAPDSDAVMEAGMIVTVEPGAYGESLGGGCRFEENVLVTAEGCKILSDASIRG